ncbi:MAG: FMN-binding protein [Spirochaetaceae bacterium]|jgi:electron transport complex protein RnfG|nr:FMN-binding protein [Spirochaetaceae bacterium]
MKQMLKLGLVLALYATAACVGLAFVYDGTKGTIAWREQAALEDALKELFPDGDSFEDISGTIASPDGTVRFGSQYAVRRGGVLIGAALSSSGPSYGGPVSVLVGTGTDGKVSSIKILSILDTPGLGANASSPRYYVDAASGLTFYGQFSGKAAGDAFEPKGDVAAITAATITSRAVSSVVRTSARAAAAWLAAQGGVK